jgi:hypothetical protein
MTAHPDSPSAMAARLGLSLDLSLTGSPAIVGETGKRHYYPHGRNAGRREATAILRRLLRIKEPRP